MEKTKIFAPFYLKKIVENFEGYWMGGLASLVVLMLLLPVSNLVLGFPRLVFSWKDVLFMDLGLLFLMGIVIFPILYWANEEYKGKRFRTALAEATLLNWFWTLILIPAGIVNILKLIIVLFKIIYETLKKPIIWQTIKKSVIVPISVFLRRIKKKIAMSIPETFKKIGKALKAPFEWLQKIWRLWRDNPILNGDKE